MAVGGDGIRSVGFNPDGDLLVIGTLASGYPPGGIAEVREVETGLLRFTLGGCFAAISPMGDYVAGGGGGVNRYVAVRTIPAGASVASFYHGGYISDVAWHPDGLRVASCGSNNEVRLWDVEHQTLERTFGPHDNDVSAIVFSPDGTLLAASEGGWDSYPAGSAIRIWRVADGELLRVLEGHGVWVYDIGFSPDGQTIISAGRDQNTPLRISIRLWHVAGGPFYEEYDEAVTGGVPSICFNPVGGAFAYSRGDGNVLVAEQSGDLATVAGSVLEPHVAFLHAPAPTLVTGVTNIGFSLQEAGHVALTVHDVNGRRLASLAESRLPAGEHRVRWDGRSNDGGRVDPGVYYVRLATGGGETEARQLVVSGR